MYSSTRLQDVPKRNKSKEDDLKVVKIAAFKLIRSIQKRFGLVCCYNRLNNVLPIVHSCQRYENNTVQAESGATNTELLTTLKQCGQ